jgi:hypothetical protein
MQQGYKNIISQPAFICSTFKLNIPGYMKSLCFLYLAVVISILPIKLFAQHTTNASNGTNNNLLKINIPALAFSNFSIQYERKLSTKTSVALALRYRPEGSIPFRSIIQDMVDDASIRLDLARIGNWGITPEYRFYLGKNALQGFYLAPFISYNYYKGIVPVKYYDYSSSSSYGKTAPFNGSVNTFTAGLQIGAQWKLSKRFALDWWIIGPNYGTSNGRFDFKAPLTDIEQISLQFELEKIQQTLPLFKISIPAGTPNDNGAAFLVDGPWAGIRAMGLNLAYNF